MFAWIYPSEVPCSTTFYEFLRFVSSNRFLYTSSTCLYLFLVTSTINPRSLADSSYATYAYERNLCLFSALFH